MKRTVLSVFVVLTIGCRLTQAKITDIGQEPGTNSKERQAPLSIVPVSGKHQNSEPFQLETVGGSGTGAVTFKLTKGSSNVASVSRQGVVTPYIVGAIGVTAFKAEDENYLEEESKQLTITFSPQRCQITWIVNGIAYIDSIEFLENNPAFSGGTPTKPPSNGYAYTFARWEPPVKPVTDDATYTAVFDSTTVKGTDPLGIDEVETAGRPSLQTYPNPTTEHLTVESKQLRTGDVIEICTMGGQVVAQFTAAGQQTRVALNGITTGTYIVRVARIGASTKVVKTKK